MAAYTRATIETIYSATINDTVAKNCDKKNEGTFRAELKLSCQLAEQLMSEISDICQSTSTETCGTLLFRSFRGVSTCASNGDQPCWEANMVSHVL